VEDNNDWAQGKALGKEQVDKVFEFEVCRLEVATRVNDSTAEGANARVFRHVLDAGVDCAFRDDRVAVQQKHVWFRAETETDIVCRGEPDVRTVLEQPDMGKLIQDHLGGAIRAGIVYHDYFVANPPLRGKY